VSTSEQNVPATSNAPDNKSPFWRVLASRGKTAAERWLHPLRRYLVLRRLRGARVASVLFICEGNIYRSPFAAAFFLNALPAAVRSAVRVSSAGFVGPGRQAPPDAVEAARSHSIDLTEHRSTLIGERMSQDWDVIVVMDARQARALHRLGVRGSHVIVLGDFDSNGAQRRAIADPWQQPASVLHGSYARIVRCVSELTRVIFAEPL
jgi:protein-tyrosine phosphatase